MKLFDDEILFPSSNAIGLGVLIFSVNKPCAANHAFRAGELWKEYKNRFKDDGYLYSLMHTLLVVSLDTGMHVMPILEDALMTLLVSFKEAVCLFIKAIVCSYPILFAWSQNICHILLV